MEDKAKIGLIGLAVMGENLALNIEEKGFPIAVYNRTVEKVAEFVQKNAGKKIIGCTSPKELVAKLERPRRIIMMVKAGKPVDDTIAAVKPFLDKDDMLVDGGNEFFENTERRARALEGEGLNYVGMGVSGGEEGARHGPSMMPGGQRFAYDALAPILTKIAAQVDDGPCVDYMGPGGAGHYVKMVHNGIEYGDMQLIAEVYDLLGRGLGMSAAQMAELFQRWNEGPLSSFLIELTAKILTVKDQASGKPLVELVVDRAGQKGTGRWTGEFALELGIPIPTIAAAIDARLISSMKEEREVASAHLRPITVPPPEGDRQALTAAVADALLCSKICSYAQGMHLIRAGSECYKWNISLREMARIWKGGCIIRARLLDPIMHAFERDLPNLLIDDALGAQVQAGQAGWRKALALATGLGIPTPALFASLAYFDSYRTARLPQNLTQAQRDAFGAHTYERIDQPGKVLHTDWLS
jgi:6-phosphogluconate dehydrogenase